MCQSRANVNDVDRTLGTLCRLGGQYSYFNIKWNKMPRIRVNRHVASVQLINAS